MEFLNQFKTEFSKELEKREQKKDKISVEIKLINQNEYPTSNEIELLGENIMNYLKKEKWDICEFDIKFELSMFIMIRFQVSL